MKKFLLILLFTLSVISYTSADGILEGFETGLQDPFGGTAELIWTGDISDFMITTSTWPYGSDVDFDGDYSIRSKDNGELNSTIITDITDTYNSSLKMHWEVYASGNSASITLSKGFAMILFVDSDNIADIENGNVNGYRIRLADPSGGDPDGLYLEKASGSGWIKIDEILTGSANINQGWNLVVERINDGTWNWGYSNDSLGNPVTLTESVTDNDHISGSWAGMYWYSTSTDAADFGFDNFTVDPSTPGLWKTNPVSNLWSVEENWDDGSLPGEVTDVIIPGGALFYPLVDISSASCNNITIKPGAQLSIDENKTLDVNGNFLIESDSAGTGSFLNEGSLLVNQRGTSTFERYIEAWSNNEDGWHLLSSPVGNFTIAGSDFEPGENDDLYQWDEQNNLWLNYKVESFDFQNAKGNLVAYSNSGVKDFNGSFSSSDVEFSNLSLGNGNGWHLLGNPYPCALLWNNGLWDLNNVETSAQVYNEDAGNYFAITAGETIPATQGFFVKVTNSDNSLTIPAEARTHDNTQLYNFNNEPELILQVSGLEQDFYDQTMIRFTSEASSYYDENFDSHKLFGQESAPQLLSLSEDLHQLSVNSMEEYYDQIVQLEFYPGIEGMHQIKSDRILGFGENIELLLEDIVCDSVFEINSDSSIYSFNSSFNDPSGRFKLHFKLITSNNMNEPNGMVKIYNCGKSIYIIGRDRVDEQLPFSIIDLQGRKVYEQLINLNGEKKLTPNLAKGLYFIEVPGYLNKAQKIIIK